jgi:hypothetical protein
MSSNQRSAEEIPDTVTEPLVLALQADMRALTSNNMHPLTQHILENLRRVENERPALPRNLNLILDPPVRADYLWDGWDNVPHLLPDDWDNVTHLLPDFHALPDLVSDDSDDESYTNASMAA